MNFIIITASLSRKSALCVALILDFFRLALCSEVEPIKIDLQDDYYVGESLQVWLILPRNLKSAFVLLRGPDGKLQSLLPNSFESFSPGESPSRKRLFPNPSLGYQAIVEDPGEYRLMTVHIEALPNDPEWPKTAPPELVGMIRSINRAIQESGSDSEPMISTQQFSVKPGRRPDIETLRLIDGILDGLGNPVFASGSTRLAKGSDYGLLWRWAWLMNSPAHRHQSFLIECHAVEGQTRKANLELSQKRADSILTYLVEECRIPRERLTATGKGDFERLPEIEPEDLRNNRVTIVLDNAAGARILR